MIQTEIQTRYSTKNINFLNKTEMGRDILLLNKPENRNTKLQHDYGINGNLMAKKNSFLNLVEKYAMLTVLFHNNN